ncbi:MAG: Gfo/Idh/MocA family oxidoreductase [Microbacterium sp.]|nr:Gfo/Idh/MocA family oxidoreductase [Microbacterium sp.]
MMANTQATTPPHRGLTVGLGSIGRRHLANLLERGIGPVAAVSASATPHRLPLGVTLYRDVATAIEAFRPDFAIIANASSAHITTAQLLAEAGVHLFIEKPLSDHVEGLEPLKAACARAGLVTLVAYTLRFLPAMLRTRELLPAIGAPLFLSATVGQYLPDWRPGQDYRAGVSARRELGGGVLLELSHEIDYVRWLLGPPDGVFAMTSHSGLLEIDVEDCADLLLAYPRARAHIHLDFLERGKNRTCRIVGSEGTLETNLVAGTVSLSKAGDDRPVIEQPTSTDPYKAALAHFLDCIAHGQQTRIPLAEGAATLSLIEAARRAAATGTTVSLVAPVPEAQKAPHD